MKKKGLLFLSTAAVAVTLAACGGKGQSSDTTTTSAKPQPKMKFASEVTHEGTPIKGGTLKYAIVSPAPFKGVFMDELASDSVDSQITSQIDTTLFEFDDNRRLTNTGLASVEFDIEGKTATVKLNSKDYKFSDGQPLTIDDYIFAIEAIGNKDYTGVRYNGNYQNIEGMDKFHSGEASSISGVEKLDDYSVKIHFKQMRPSMQLAGGSLPSYVLPKHIFSSIPITEWEKSEYVRGTKGVGLGAFKIESIVPGESVTLVPNEHFYKGHSKVDKVVMEVVSPDTVVSQVKSGNYDIASMPSSQFEAYKDLTNVSFISSFASQYEYIAFHLGKFDKEQGKNITDPKTRAFILNYYLDSFKGTLFRQTQFAEFEQFIHESDAKGEPLTAEILNQFYGDLNQRYYGSSVTPGGQIAKEWSRIPHFYYNFYFYQYATGFAAATALSNNVVHGDKKQLEDYLNFLRSGSSDYPTEIMKKAGVDMTKADYLENAFATFEKRLNEFESLIGKF